MTPQRYRTLLKMLTQEAQALNCPIRFRRATSADAWAAYDVLHHRIIVCYPPTTARLKVLLAIAHELRHAQHKVQGRYANYYDLRWQVSTPLLITNFLHSPRAERPNLKTAVAAETDCNRFACAWVRHQGETIPKTRTYRKFLKPYPVMATQAYHIHYLIQEFRKDVQKISQRLAIQKIRVTKFIPDAQGRAVAWVEE